MDPFEAVVGLWCLVFGVRHLVLLFQWTQLVVREARNAD